MNRTVRFSFFLTVRMNKYGKRKSARDKRERLRLIVSTNKKIAVITLQFTTWPFWSLKYGFIGRFRI